MFNHQGRRDKEREKLRYLEGAIQGKIKGSATKRTTTSPGLYSYE
jgi:hypothetical protein